MTDIPKKVKVNHTVYPILKLNNKTAVNTHKGDRIEFWGHISVNAPSIEFNVDTPIHRKREVLLHEIIHAIDFAAGSSLTEEQVTMLAIGLDGVMKDNPRVKDYIFGGQND